MWESPFEVLRWPMLEYLRMDPFERANDEASSYIDWAGTPMFMLAPQAPMSGSGGDRPTREVTQHV